MAEALESRGFHVERQRYQSDPFWYCDIVAVDDFCTYYMELENDMGSVREGMGQAIGYCSAADDPRGIPAVVTPAGHIEQPDWRLLRAEYPGLMLEYDSDSDQFH